MMDPVLRNMRPLVAAATQCRLGGRGAIVNRQTNDPATGESRSVRLHGDLVVIYMLRAAGGRSSRIPMVVREDPPPQRFDKVFYLDADGEADAFFRSYQACGDMLHRMLAQTPVVGEFDLAADNWDDGFPPHDVAARIVSRFRRDTDQNMGVAPQCNVDVSLVVRVEAVYSEPRALLLACKKATEVLEDGGWVIGTGAASAAECCVCMEDLTVPREYGSSDTVILPCSHVFHSSCLLPWFHRVSTCPVCRRDMAMFLVGHTRCPQGMFPGLEDVQGHIICM